MAFLRNSSLPGVFFLFLFFLLFFTCVDFGELLLHSSSLSDLDESGVQELKSVELQELKSERVSVRSLMLDLSLVVFLSGRLNDFKPRISSAREPVGGTLSMSERLCLLTKSLLEHIGQVGGDLSGEAD